MNLTDEQLSTLLDALEQWEDGLDTEMQGDELAEARKDTQALREVLVDALVTVLGQQERLRSGAQA